MRPQDEDTWEASYWDDILHDFGVHAYIELREQQHPNPPHVEHKEERRMTRLKSMDVTIDGVTHNYDFGSGIEVSTDDEGAASLEVLEQAETTEVVLSKGIASARVVVQFTYTVDGQVEVDLSDLEGIEDSDDLIAGIEAGDDEVTEAILDDVSSNTSYEHISVDRVEVEELFDEDGESIGFLDRL